MGGGGESFEYPKGVTIVVAAAAAVCSSEHGLHDGIVCGVSCTSCDIPFPTTFSQVYGHQRVAFGQTPRVGAETQQLPQRMSEIVFVLYCLCYTVWSAHVHHVPYTLYAQIYRGSIHPSVYVFEQARGGWVA